ncbi:MAG: transcriptional repressor [Bacteroidales bacterium]|nr:transcriptional repressor [Bacteroidales bacterium]
MKPIEILHQYQLKRTSCREGILSVIINHNEALSENEIRDQLESHYDRTTFYRAFKTLIESKIVHKIVVDNQLVKYALDNHITQKKEHAHFYCEACHAVLCLETTPLPKPNLPNGFQANNFEYVIKGLCKKCSPKA